MLSTFLELQRWIVFLFFVSYSFKFNSRWNLYWVSDELIKLANKCINSNLALLSYACQKYYCYSFFEMYQQCHCWYEQNFCCNTCITFLLLIQVALYIASNMVLSKHGWHKSIFACFYQMFALVLLKTVSVPFPLFCLHVFPSRLCFRSFLNSLRMNSRFNFDQL